MKVVQIKINQSKERLRAILAKRWGTFKMKKILISIFLLIVNCGFAQDTNYIQVADFPPIPVNDSAFVDWMEGEVEKLKEKYKINCDTVDYNAVTISYIIDTNGNVIDTEILRGLNPSIDKEALEIIRNMEFKWHPGKKNGEKVSVIMTAPFYFCPKEEVIENNKRKK